MSASEVSEINSGLDEMVDEFRSRKLDAEYPVIWADALYEKIRDNHRIAGKAVMVIKAVNLEGQQEILAVEPMEMNLRKLIQLFSGNSRNAVLKKYGCVFPMHTKDCRRQYAAHCLELPGRDARFIL